MPAPIIGVVAHVGKPGAGELVREICADLRQRGIAFLLEQNTASLVGETSPHEVADLGKCCDLILVLGGDGSILLVMHQLGENVKPLFGINLGTLGFLTCVSAANSAQAVEAVATGSYVLSLRRLLDVEVESGGKILARRTGLNDAVINRGKWSHLIKLGVKINSETLTEYNADGLIIATPTGSTAYSLAAGGPLMTPDSGVFVITPICPHVLTNRSLIVSDESVIEVAPCAGQGTVYLTVDGQDVVPIDEKSLVRIRRARNPLLLAMLPGATFFEVLRQKLKWSGTAV